MQFNDQGLLDKQGKYGCVGKCTVNGRIQIYKTLQIPMDYSLEIEYEASARLNHPNFYRINALRNINGIPTLLMDPISGPVFYDFMNDQTLEACLTQAAQVLLSIQLMNEKGITHNDLHLGNIIVTKTARSKISYRLKDKTIVLKTHGYRPVFIDFGLAFIKGYKYRPSIVSDDAGNVSYAVFEPRFDLLKFLLFFTHEFIRHAQARNRLDMMWFPTAIARYIKTPTRVAFNGMFERGLCTNVGDTAITFFRQFHNDAYNIFSRPFMSLLTNVQTKRPAAKTSTKMLVRILQYVALSLQVNADFANAVWCKQVLGTNSEPKLRLAIERLAGVFNEIVLAKVVYVNHRGVKRQFDRMPLQTGVEWVQTFFSHRIKDGK